MAKKFYDELADILYSEVMMADSYRELLKIDNLLFAIGNARTVASERSWLKNDLERCENGRMYLKNEIEEKINFLMSRDIKDKHIKHIRTRELYDAVIKKFKNELYVEREIWETALIIYSIGMLLESRDEVDVKTIKEFVRGITNSAQRRNATIVTRVYENEPDDVLNIFSLDEI